MYTAITAQTRKMEAIIAELTKQRDELMEALRRLAEVATKETADIIGFDGADALDEAIDNAQAVLQSIEYNN